MLDSSGARARHSITTGFMSTLLPLYESGACPPTDANFVDAERAKANISKIAINLYCPSQTIDDYAQLLCKEFALRKPTANPHQALASLWWLGSPLKQFSPEGVTELCFRLASQFPHTQTPYTRGLVVTPMDIDGDSLALLKGLDFNAIKINIDASIASSDRSLSSLESALDALSDYQAFNLSSTVRYGAQSHPDFLSRLIETLETFNCTHIKVISRTSGPSSLEEHDFCRKQLDAINVYFKNSGWLVCGNNNFYAPSHPIVKSHQQENLEASPWGYHPRQITSWFGLGIGALTLQEGNYQQNTVSEELYRRLLARKTLPVDTCLTLKKDQQNSYHAIQNLLCQHQIRSQDSALRDQLALLKNHDWLSIDEKNVSLTQSGIINLSALCQQLSAKAHD